MIVLEIVAVWLALTVAFLVLILVPERLYRVARGHRAALEDARRRRRIAADRRIVAGEDPLPPGVDLDAAYVRSARDGVPLADAAFAIHRERTLAVIRKAVRHPRPGD